MCFPSSWGKRETHKQNSQEISGKGRDCPGTVPGQSLDNPVKILFMCFLVYWFLSALTTAARIRTFWFGRPQFSVRTSMTRRVLQKLHPEEVCMDTLVPIGVYRPSASNDDLRKVMLKKELLGSDSGRTDFSRIYIFGPPVSFADFVAGFFLLIFVGKSAQKNPPGKSPAKSSKIYTTKIPDTFLQRGRAKN